MELLVHSVRRIKAKPGHVTGGFKEGKEYESFLERSFLLQLRFDLAVRDFVTYPVQIEFEYQLDLHTYVPDVLVYYHPDSTGQDRPPILFEVKPKAFDWSEDSIEAAKFAAAESVCERLGWQFRIVYQDEFQTPRLQNAEFLVQNMHRVSNPAHSARLLEFLAAYGGVATAEQLMQAACSKREDRAHWLRDLWTLVAQRKVKVDMDTAITMSTLISMR